MIEIILENLVKMLTERDTLDKKDFDKNLKNLKDQITEEKIFKIKGKNPEEEYNILYVSGKISTIKKIQGLDTFLTKQVTYWRIYY